MTTRTSLFFDAAAVRSAVAGALTQSDALRALGQKPQADNYRRLREACVRYGLDIPGYDSTGRPSRRLCAWDDVRRVREALEGAESRAQVLVRMGLALAAKNYRAMEAAAERHGYVLPPLGRNGQRGWNRTGHVAAQRAAIADMPDDELRAAIIQAGSSRLFLVSRELEPNQANGAWLAKQTFKRKLDLPRSPAGRKDPKPNDELFARGTRYVAGTHRRRILRDKLLPHECAECGLGPTWNGKRLTLQVDHIDGDPTNNLIENLRFLCPNCHSQTDTFCRPVAHRRAE